MVLDEAKMINKSLHTLSKVISALAQQAESSTSTPSTPTAAAGGSSDVSTVDGSSTAPKRHVHVPYRDSKCELGVYL
jgi:hypothetical protein